MIFRPQAINFPPLSVLSRPPPPPPPQALTFALLAISCLVKGVAVEAPAATFAVLAFRVAQTLQTSTSDGVAHSQGVEVHVAVALAPRARSGLPGLSQGVAVITVFAHLTAHPCTTRSRGGGGGESIRQESDGWLSCGAAGGRHQRLQSQN